MDLHLNVPVRCADGAGGHTTRVVLNPLTKIATHIVVRGPARFFDTERLVPVESITDSGPEEVVLRLTRRELGSMQRFLTDEFVELPGETTEFSWGNAVYWPYVAPVRDIVDITQPSIPPEELAVRRGDRVEATDGQIGHVDGFLVDRATEAITHLVLRQGHFWGQHEVTIPISQIDAIDSGVVRLSVGKEALVASAAA